MNHDKISPETRMEQAAIYAKVREMGRVDRERLLVDFEATGAALHIYLAAQRAHTDACEAEKAVMLQRLVSGHMPVPVVPPMPAREETPGERFDRLLRRRNRVLLAIALALYLPGIYILVGRIAAGDYTPVLKTAGAMIAAAAITIPAAKVWKQWRKETF